MEGRGQAGHETFLGQRSVAELAALVIHHDPHRRPESFDDPFLLPRQQRRRTLHIEGQLNPGSGLVGVLATRTAGRAEANLELGEGNLHGAVDPEVIFGHTSMLAYAARRRPPGCSIVGNQSGLPFVVTGSASF